MPAWFLLALAIPVDHVAATVDGHVIWESQVDDRTRQSPATTHLVQMSHDMFPIV